MNYLRELCRRCHGTGYYWSMGDCMTCGGTGYRLVDDPGPLLDGDPLKFVLNDRLYRSAPRFAYGDRFYRSWMASHPRGFVLMKQGDPHETAFVLHRASCALLADDGATSKYDSQRLCGDAEVGLDTWALHWFGVQPERCRNCIS